MQNVLTFLGKDAGFGENNNSAYFIENNRFVLIDCGITVFSKLQKMKDLLESVDGIDVIITHLHDDHAGSLAQFILWCHFVLKKNINLMSACKDIEACLAMRGAPRKDASGTELYTRNFNRKIQFIQTTHAAGMDCYGFYTTIGNASIVYTGDTKTLAPFAYYIDKGENFYLFVDVSANSGEVHLKLDEHLEYLRKISDTGAHVVLMHLDDKEKIAQMIQGTPIEM